MGAEGVEAAVEDPGDAGEDADLAHEGALLRRHAAEVGGGVEDVGGARGGGRVEVVRRERDGQVRRLEVGAPAGAQQGRRVVHLGALAGARVRRVRVVGRARGVPGVRPRGFRGGGARVEGGDARGRGRGGGGVGGACVGEDLVADLLREEGVERGLLLEVDGAGEELCGEGGGDGRHGGFCHVRTT